MSGHPTETDSISEVNLVELPPEYLSAVLRCARAHQGCKVTPLQGDTVDLVPCEKHAGMV